MKILITVVEASLVLTCASSFATTNWDYSPVEAPVPSCIAYFDVTLPGDYNSKGPDEIHINDVLHKKGYIANYEVPCDSGPDSCYGVSGYLSVVGVIHQMINSKFVEPDEIRVNITHQQNRLIPGGEEQANVGVYHNKKATLSGSTELDRAKMIKMVEKIPSCAQLKVLELRDCSKDKHCGNGLFINDWSN